MKKSTIRLVALAAVLYYAALFLAQSSLPKGLNAPFYLLIGPLVVLFLVLVTDLSSRATMPSETRMSVPPSRKLAREVQLLKRQIEVGAKSSPAYFETVLLTRLREVLVGKVSLETGMNRERVREVLASPHLGPGLLRDDGLYRLLYTPVPASEPSRVRKLQDAIILIEAWKA